MKYTIKNNITKVQRSIAYVLLLSELLISCGFKETIVPSIQPQAHSTSTWPVQQDTSLTASYSTFQLSTTTIEGKKLTFAYTPAAGLQAKYQDPTMPEAVPIQQYPIIQDVTGVKQTFSQLTKGEAALLATAGKWEVKERALRYNGMRGSGGMQKQGEKTPLSGRSSVSSLASPKAKAMQKQPSRGTISSPTALLVSQPSAEAQTPSPSASSTSPQRGARSSIAKAKPLTRQLTKEGTQSARPSVHTLTTALKKSAASTPAKQPPLRKAPTLSRTSLKDAKAVNSQLSTAKPKTQAPAPKESIYDLLQADASACKGETILDKEAIASMLAGKTSIADTTHKIIPYFGKEKAEKDNGCRFLSNFYSKEAMTILLQEAGKTYVFKCVETYYQCRKCLVSPSEAGKATNKADMIKEFQACDPKASKKLANQKYFAFDARYLSEMDDVMFAGLLQKFPNDLSNPLTQKLLSTGNAILVEGNEWGDKSWGMVYDADNETFDGENKLGRMLMLIRHARSKEQTDSDVNKTAWEAQKMDNLLAGKFLKQSLSEAFSVMLPYKLMTPSSKEVAFVQDLYERTASSDQKITKVEKIRSRPMNQAYVSKLSLLDRRQGSWIFDPKWTFAYLDKAIEGCKADLKAKRNAFKTATTKEEKSEEEKSEIEKIEKKIKALEEQQAAYDKKHEDAPFRKEVHDRLMKLVEASGLTSAPYGAGVKEVWMWHGTSKAAATGLMTSGFASLASRDDGFYGKGLYFSSNLGSIQAAYNPEVLLLSKVCFYSAYPVAKSWDLKELYNKNNYDNHDVHYVPTFRKPLPKDVYDALKSSPDYRSIPDDPTKARNYPIDAPGVEPTADEFVVFDPSQILLSYRIETTAGAKSSQAFYEEIKQKEEAAKKQEDKLTAGLEIASITQEKLDNPNKVLTVDESIEVLKNCLVMGKQRAQDAVGKDLLIFIGNTGAGKSTTVNYLAGCEMEYVDMEDLGLRGEGEIVRVKASSEKQELMSIGYTNVSRTFVPTIATDTTTADGKQYTFTYCDCPGFWDNRGPEINIANAANIQATVSAAKSVRIILLLNYHSLKADRSRGLKETSKILLEMLGFNETTREKKKKAELDKLERDKKILSISQDHEAAIVARVEEQEKDQVKQSLKSALICITQVPTDGISSPKNVSKLRNNFQDFEIFQDQKIVTFDVWDETIPGGITRAEILAQINQLPPIVEPQKAFRTVLQSSDESRLREIGQELNQRVTAGIQSNAWDSVKAVLTTFDHLNEIEHNYTKNIYAEIHATIDQKLSILSTQLNNLCMNANYAEAEQELAKLSNMSQQFAGTASCTPYVAMYGDNAAYVQQSKENYKKYKAELEKLEANKDALGSVKFQLVQQQGKISSVSTALEQTKQQLSALEADYEKDKSTLQSAYERDTKKIDKDANAINKTRQQKERAATYASDQEALAKKHTDALGEYKALQSNQEATLSKLREEEKGLLSQQKSLEEAATRGNADQKRLELKRLLDKNYLLGEDVWKKLIDVKKDSLPLPYVSDELLNKIRVMQTQGGQPIVFLVLGYSIQELEEMYIRTQSGLFRNAKLFHDDKHEKNIKEAACYKDKAKLPKQPPYWVLINGLDHGIVPGTRNKSYQEQVGYQQKHYPDYKVGSALELIQFIILQHLQDSNTNLFTNKPITYGRVSDQYQVTGPQTTQVVFGNFTKNDGVYLAKGGYLIDDKNRGNEYGLFGVVGRY